MPRGRPRKQQEPGQVQAGAPVALEEVDVQTAAPSRKSNLRDGWYWFGMVPCSEPVKMLYPNGRATLAGREGLDEYIHDPWRMWARKENVNSDVAIFVAKCRQYTRLDVRGFAFLGVSEDVDPQPENVNRIPFAGNATRLRARAAEAIIRSAFAHVVRFASGTAGRMHPSASAQVLDLTPDERPSYIPQDQWERMPHFPEAVDKTFDPETDIRVAEFVYFKFLPDVAWHAEGLDEEEYKWKSNRFHQTICAPLTESFFRHPPLSVAEMYPEFAPAT